MGSLTSASAAVGRRSEVQDVSGAGVGVAVASTGRLLLATAVVIVGGSRVELDHLDVSRVVVVAATGRLLLTAAVIGRGLLAAAVVVVGGSRIELNDLDGATRVGVTTGVAAAR